MQYMQCGYSVILQTGAYQVTIIALSVPGTGQLSKVDYKYS